MDLVRQFQILAEADYISLQTNVIKKGMNQSLLLSANNK